MKQLVTDLKTLILNNWKAILLIAVVAYFISNYMDVKQGIKDGWLNK